MKLEPRENKEPEARLNGKQGPGHWMLKYEESIGGGGGTPSGASNPADTAGGSSVSVV